MTNSAVALMRRPAVRRRLQAELAALPHQLVSYEEMLAFFLDYGAMTAVYLVNMDGEDEASLLDIRTAGRLAVELLPQLAPDNPHPHYRAASLGKSIAPSSPTNMAAALAVALSQGSDFYVALCGYEVATAIEQWVAESGARRRVPPPSAVLGWLQQAEAAHRRCRALLPKQWTMVLDSWKAGPAAETVDHGSGQLEGCECAGKGLPAAPAAAGRPLATHACRGTGAGGGAAGCP